LQNNDGSLISIVSLDHASPPSAATKQSKYGGVNTSCTWAAASTYAYGAKVFKSLGMDKYSDTLKAAAIKAYTWAEANPAVIWRNNDAAYNSSGVGAGQQEVDDYGRLGYRLRSCSHLYEITSDAKYKTYFESNYSNMHLIQWYFAYPYETREQEMLLYYTGLTGINSTVKSTILSRYTSGMNGDHNLKALNNKRDPYMAHIDSYTWGSNNTKSNQGSLFMDAIKYNTNASSATLFKNAAEDYVHYIHGVNPLNKCYLSNMSARGAENSVSQFYHSWFKDKSTLWDEVGVSTYGPAPGFLVGGPNSSYKKDACCDGGCGGTANNAVCTSFDVSKVIGQPRQKSYADFNTNWPLNSWEVTENSCGYQIAYIKLLSKFVDRSSVINGLGDNFKSEKKLVVYPNPSHGAINIDIPVDFDPISVTITDMAGIQVYSSKYEEDFIMLENIKEGTYILDVQGAKSNVSEKIIVR
jgi:endoglucanase